MMRKTIQNLIVLLSILSFFAVYACAVAVVGIGAAGVGAFAYFNGKLTKTYESEYHKTVQASSATLEELKIPIYETIADELKSVIKAKRPDGTPVEIEIVKIDQDFTQVSVRTGSVGIWDKRVSEQIHAHINEALSEKIAGGKKSSGNLEKENLHSSKERVVKAVIIEEDLTQNSKPAKEHTETGTAPALQVLEKKRFKAARMLAGSAFYIFFEQDSNELSPKAIEKLDRVYEILANNPAAKLTLNGYSDASGAPSYNQMISENRANAVKSYLSGKGIKSSRMVALGHGAQKFLVSNKNAEGRGLNRRVEIELIIP
jgi:outer membrane protein OmpA-like peptidoglycan-associated protein